MALKTYNPLQTYKEPLPQHTLPKPTNISYWATGQPVSKDTNRPRWYPEMFQPCHSLIGWVSMSACGLTERQADCCVFMLTFLTTNKWCYKSRSWFCNKPPTHASHSWRYAIRFPCAVPPLLQNHKSETSRHVMRKRGLWRIMTFMTFTQGRFLFKCGWEPLCGGRKVLVKLNVRISKFKLNPNPPYSYLNNQIFWSSPSLF